MDTAGNASLLAALYYAKRGWFVLPCRPRDKRPATKHGFKDATTDKAYLVQAWGAEPSYNVAIATGSRSGIVVLDVDPRNGGDASLVELERLNGPLPETVSVATGGGGRHFYFLAPEREVRGGVLAPGLDVKANRGYIIAPPSVHPDGGEYCWVNHPKDTELAPCPDWVRPTSQKKADRKAKREVPADAAYTPIGRSFAQRGMLALLS